MPRLVRFYIRHVLIGFGLSAAFVAMLLYFNVANLWHLVTHSPDGLLAVGLLVMFNGIVFSGAQFGIAVMRLAEDERPPRGGVRQFDAIPVPVEDRRC
ncbi:hypothetical protein [Tranquillimonas alkanivorans]|uniref:Uncharacterized protein n=1 Tax=Tranquillimonas alkanivorans TaxID=441119 RepID=A0A1I5QY16_9RHOB|nr:hypothetical protein [Tranquillimonas alkanivorans]SFP51133.1 hypothetical protein SAMN04488047_107173 [Tranquillimonas alkanivorans]